MFRVLEELTFTAPKFDLSSLPDYTGPKTRIVTVNADTVYMSSMMRDPINYQLNIRARKVSIDHPIAMFYSKAYLFSSNDWKVDPWAETSTRYILESGIIMESKRFGLIDILQEAPKDSLIDNGENDHCLPALFNLTEDNNVHMNAHLDSKAINLAHIAAKTLAATGSNNKNITGTSCRHEQK